MMLLTGPKPSADATTNLERNFCLAKLLCMMAWGGFKVLSLKFLKKQKPQVILNYHVWDIYLKLDVNLMPWPSFSVEPRLFHWVVGGGWGDSFCEWDKGLTAWFVIKVKVLVETLVKSTKVICSA